jgi:hypothetical protein
MTLGRAAAAEAIWNDVVARLLGDIPCTVEEGA